MYLDELTIHGFRGFPKEERTIEFGGGSGVIVGDNGTGKSSVLAAIEFLLTGGMTHLSGPGTGDIQIQTHAPHQEADPEDCYVRGKFVTEEGDSGEFERCGDDHRNLEKINGDIDADDVSVSQWNDEHLLLTRGQLLEFIESPPGDRGDHLSKLLNLSGITNRAKGFARVSSKLGEKVDRRKETCERHVRDIESAIDHNIDYPLTDEELDVILTSVNEKLSELNGPEIENLDALSAALENVNLTVPQDSVNAFHEASTEDRLNSTRDWAQGNKENIEDRLDSLAADLAELDAVEGASLLEMDLFEAANDIIAPETTMCPLCGESHDEGYLHDRVETERESLKSIRELRSDVRSTRNRLRNDLQAHRDEVEEVLDRLEEGENSGNHGEVDGEIGDLSEYIDEIEDIIEVLSNDLVQQLDDGSIEVMHLNPEELAPNWDLVEASSSDIMEYIDNLDPLEEYSTIHGDIVTINNAWESLDEEQSALEHLAALTENMDRTQELFTEARNEGFEELYADIEGLFNQLYGTIHPDEQDIDLDFDADATDSVKLEANFEDERDSPLAYHSEGHIDTMGICLFLALRDHLNMSGPEIVMLDDIVMSVDKTHRRGVARLLQQYLDDGPQAILATHDEVWGDQLTESSVVNRNNVIEITDWDISTGPMMHGASWDVIEEYLDENRPHAAAAHLRRQAEKLGRVAAIKLKPQMEYKERYGLADFIYGISGQIKTVAKGAKRHHADHSDEWVAGKELDDQRSDLLGEFGLNELNGMVHYRRDDWGQLGVDDLRDVLEHWREIDDFLHCGDNGDMIYYEESGDWCWIQCDCRTVQVGYDSS